MLSQVLQLLHDDLIAIPEALGDARKETPEELAERHERVLAGSLLAFSSLLDLLVSVEPQQAVNGLLCQHALNSSVPAVTPTP